MPSLFEPRLQRSKLNPRVINRPVVLLGHPCDLAADLGVVDQRPDLGVEFHQVALRALGLLVQPGAVTTAELCLHRVLLPEVDGRLPKCPVALRRPFTLLVQHANFRQLLESCLGDQRFTRFNPPQMDCAQDNFRRGELLGFASLRRKLATRRLRPLQPKTMPVTALLFVFEPLLLLLLQR